MNKQFKFKSKSLKDFCDDNARLKAFYNTSSDDYDEKFENFKEALKDFKADLKENLARKETEPNVVSNVLKPFFTKLGFKAENKSLKGQISIDLALFKKDKVGVLIEAKLPTNDEFPHLDDFNKKGLHQAIFYYLWERKVELNLKISYIIITDFKRFYIIDIKEFCRCFYNEFTETAFEKFYDKEQRLFKNTDDFYDEIQSIIKSEKYRNKYLTPKSEKLFDDKGNALTPSPIVEGIYLNLTPFIDNDKNDEKLFKEAFKIFSKDFLNDEFTFKDANEINEPFYKELLYILGLEETTEKGKKSIIKHNNVQNSVYDLIKRHLSDKDKLSGEAQKDNELIMPFIISWLNRILFIKLVEGNLIKFGDKSAAFFSKDFIKDFADLNRLFFEVFAKNFEERNNDKFFVLPYLNSSLFDKTDFEKSLMEISALDTFKPEIHSYHKGEKVELFSYFIDFLNSYTFSGKGEAKRLINPSILGKIFEKLNGYKDGSIFTPAEITMYMCKESIERVVVDKFNAKFKWQCENLDDLRLQIDRNFSEKNKAEFQQILKSIKICDPAVGSGHFLVSALNEMVYIYYKLGLLDFRCENIDIINDELIIDNGKYHYKREDISTLDIQKGLFHLKQNIIENNLFGVDINENSVQICKLRLWIELLKNSYYLTKDDKNFNKNLSKETHQMQTLPNIDINIKCGNSLGSIIKLSTELASYLKDKVKDYKNSVQKYKNLSQVFPNIKKVEVETEIAKAKSEIIRYFKESHKDKKINNKLRQQIEIHIKSFKNYALSDEIKLYIVNEGKNENINYITSLFDETKPLTDNQKENAKISSHKIDTLLSKLYPNLDFEWRFEFPEVLNEQGEFMGFDLVVGNPPYGVNLTQEQRQKYKEIYKISSTDTAQLFILLADKILSPNGINSFIVPKALSFASNWKQIRDFIQSNFYILADCGKAWDYVLLEMIIFIRQKGKKFSHYKTHFLEDLKDKKQNEKQEMVLDKNLINLFDFFPNDLNEKELQIGVKVRSGCKNTLVDCGENLRGDIFQKFTTKQESDFKVLGGKEIQRYFVNGIKGFVSKDVKTNDNAKIKRNSVLLQRLIAHIENPNPHIKITGTILEQNFDEFKIVDTIYQIICKKEFSNRYILGLLHSKFLNWYCYRFVFAKAIRTFQFSNEMAQRIPIPKITKENQNLADEIINLVDKILEFKKQNKDTSEFEKKIDDLVYKLYDLNDDEIKIISINS